MLSQEEYVEASALRKRGWTISAIARHLGSSRNTGKAYLRGERAPGHRERAEPDPFRAVRRLPWHPPSRRPSRLGHGSLRRGDQARL